VAADEGGGDGLQTTTPFTDFGYARMFFNADSGIYLTKYRVYDPVTARWLAAVRCRSQQRAPIGKTATSRDFALRLTGGSLPDFVKVQLAL
jgi:hypothetical protein